VTDEASWLRHCHVEDLINLIIHLRSVVKLHGHLVEANEEVQQLIGR